MPERMRCRNCGATRGTTVLDLGAQPPWDRMPDAASPLPDPVSPLRMWFCRSCRLAQLATGPDGDVATGEELLGVEPRAVAEQSDRAVECLEREGVVRPGLRVAEFGSPHGESWLPRLAGRGMADAGPDAAAGSADLVVDFYGLLHEPDQAAALRRRAELLAPGGTLALQLLPLGTLLRDGQWYDLRHGHYAYWSLPALDAALRGHGLGVHRARRYPLSGGTLLVTAHAEAAPDPATLEVIRDEDTLGVTDPAALGSLQRAADHAHDDLRGWLLRERAAGRTVAGYGAASRAVPVVCHAGLDAGLLTAVGDAAPAKQGRRMPGTDIPIISPAELAAREPDRVVLFLPELADEVRAALPEVEVAGGRWVVLEPGARLREPQDRMPAR